MSSPPLPNTLWERDGFIEHIVVHCFGNGYSLKEHDNERQHKVEEEDNESLISWRNILKTNP